MFMNANGEDDDDAVCVCALLLKGEEWTCDFNCEWGRNFKNERPSPVAAIIAAAAALKKERKMKKFKKRLQVEDKCNVYIVPITFRQ